MANEEDIKEPEPGQEPDDSQHEVEPTDLASAWSAIGKNNEAHAEDPVAPEGSDDLSAPGEPLDEYAASDNEPGASPASDEGYVSDDDYNSYGQQLIGSIQNEARRKAQQKFQDEGIRYWRVSDLYQRDEETGEVVYRNPDSGNYGRPFASRTEAQQWVDSINQQVNDTFNQTLNYEYQELLKQYQPTLQLYQFAPTYQKMSDTEKAIFDQLVQPYGVQASNGQTVGYRCNLEAMHKQAHAIAQQFGNQVTASAQPEAKPTPEAKPEPSGPAVDMKSSAPKQGADKEPSNLEEAFKMLNSK